MPTYHTITLRFIRRRQGGVPEQNPDLDDSLRIQKLGENNLRVTYTERSEDGAICDTTLMTYQRFFQYVWRVLWMLTIDVDPFQNVQLNIPGYPVILLPVTTINQNMVTIMDILMTTCWQWPVVGRDPRRVTAAETSSTESSGPPPLEPASTVTQFEA
jgi:hypothetical protein